MKHKFLTYDDLVAFAERTGIKWKRVALASRWKRWRRGAKGHARGCDHKGTIVEWNCYCSFGCDCCHLGAECTVCHSKFVSTKDTPMTVEVTLHE